jgi:SAM-dependent methyltransferase
MMFGTGSAFRYDECAGCGSLRLAEPPADLAPYYPADYYSVDVDPEVALGRPPVRQFAAAMARSVLLGGGRSAALARRVVRRRQFHTLLTLLASVRLAGLPHGAQTRILDVGCGSGVLAYALSLGGLRDVTGSDPFMTADRTLDTGVELLRRDLADVEGRYDLVMFHHSLEHVPDPDRTLEDALGRLVPGGRLLVRMPTVSSLAYRRYDADWVQLDAPRHLTVLSRAGVEQLAARHGLTVLSAVDDSTSFQFWGSEQVRLGVPLTAPTSQMMNPSASPFDRAQVSAWEHEAAALNATGEGDQVAWVLGPSG